MQAECLAGVPMIMGMSCRTPLISVPFFYIMALFSNAQNVPVPMKAASGLLECMSFPKNRTRPVMSRVVWNQGTGLKEVTELYLRAVRGEGDSPLFKGVPRKAERDTLAPRHG